MFKAKESLRTEPPQPKSPNLSTLLFRYLDIQKAKSGKYSQSWQQQHTVDELKAICFRFGNNCGRRKKLSHTVL